MDHDRLAHPPVITGIYSARFLSNKDLVGAGIIVIHGDALHGGGFDYLYKGTYRFVDDNMVHATVDIENYTEKPNPVLGLLRSYRLTLSGVAAPQSFTLSGQVEGQPQLMISIELTKIGELFDQ